MSEPTAFSIRLKKLRSSLNMTQVQFANHVGTNQVTLSAYETGSTNPSLEVVKEIAKKCNVSIDWLCGLSDLKPLGNAVTTYEELFRLFISILETRYFEFNTYPIIDIIDTDSPSVVLTLHNDENIQHFFMEWCKIFELHCAQTIDDELYHLWLEKELAKYADHKINGVPF